MNDYVNIKIKGHGAFRADFNNDGMMLASIRFEKEVCYADYVERQRQTEKGMKLSKRSLTIKLDNRSVKE